MPNSNVFISLLIVYHSSVFDFGTFFGNGVSASFHTVLGRDCRGRPQGDYFYGCQVHVALDCLGARVTLWKCGMPKTTNLNVSLKPNE